MSTPRQGIVTKWLFDHVPEEYHGLGCPSAFVGGRDFYGEWLAWQIDLRRSR